MPNKTPAEKERDLGRNEKVFAGILILIYIGFVITMIRMRNDAQWERIIFSVR